MNIVANFNHNHQEKMDLPWQGLGYFFRICQENFINLHDQIEVPMIQIVNRRIALSQLTSETMQSVLDGRPCVILSLQNRWTDQVGVLVVSPDEAGQLRNWIGTALESDLSTRTFFLSKRSPIRRSHSCTQNDLDAYFKEERKSLTNAPNEKMLFSKEFDQEGFYALAIDCHSDFVHSPIQP